MPDTSSPIQDMPTARLGKARRAINLGRIAVASAGVRPEGQAAEKSSQREASTAAPPARLPERNFLEEIRVGGKLDKQVRRLSLFRHE